MFAEFFAKLIDALSVFCMKLHVFIPNIKERSLMEASRSLLCFKETNEPFLLPPPTSLWTWNNPESHSKIFYVTTFYTHWMAICPPPKCRQHHWPLSRTSQFLRWPDLFSLAISIALQHLLNTILHKARPDQKGKYCNPHLFWSGKNCFSFFLVWVFFYFLIQWNSISN